MVTSFDIWSQVWVPLSRRSATTVATLVVASAATIWLIRRTIRRARYPMPPGPWGFPLLGNVQLFNKSGREAAQTVTDNLAREFGDMATIKMGPEEMVLVMKPELVLEGLLSKQLSSRSAGQYSFNCVTEGRSDILAAPNSERLRYHRKCAFSAFRVFAQADRLEQFIVDSFDSVSKFFADRGSEPKDIYETIYLLTYNLQCRMAFSKEYTPDDPEFLMLRSNIESLNQFFQQGLVIDLLPILRFLPLRSTRQFKSCIHSVISWAKSLVEQRQQNFNPNELNDILDFLIQEQRQAVNSGKGHLFQDVHLRQTLLDLFTGGTDTTSRTLYWAVWALCEYPAMQARCYAEIQSVFGDSTPRLAERHRLPYTDAFLHEVMRYWPLLSFIPRECYEDCRLGNYVLPHGTQVMLSVYRCHYDPAAFPDPTQFKPEHFLTDDGQLAAYKRGFLPFGAGYRVCIGESIAKKVTFLTLLLLVQSFEFVQCPADKGADAFDKNSTLLEATPRRFQVRVVPRR